MGFIKNSIDQIKLAKSVEDLQTKFNEIVKNNNDMQDKMIELNKYVLGIGMILKEMDKSKVEKVEKQLNIKFDIE